MASVSSASVSSKSIWPRYIELALGLIILTCILVFFRLIRLIKPLISQYISVTGLLSSTLLAANILAVPCGILLGFLILKLRPWDHGVEMSMLKPYGVLRTYVSAIAFFVGIPWPVLFANMFLSFAVEAAKYFHIPFERLRIIVLGFITIAGALYLLKGRGSNWIALAFGIVFAQIMIVIFSTWTWIGRNPVMSLAIPILYFAAILQMTQFIKKRWYKRKPHNA